MKKIEMQQGSEEEDEYGSEGFEEVKAENANFSRETGKVSEIKTEIKTEID